MRFSKPRFPYRRYRFRYKWRGALPLGISFYTFQALSYSVDVYRKDVAAQRSYWKLLLYVSMFPQLIAGPIVRYVDVAAQIDARELDSENIFRGVTRFCIGLGKKVLLADHIGQVADQLLGGSFAGATSVGILLGMLAYMFQIYFDFSGYSDMAIGLGKILGFTFMENFRLPYTAKSITEFWRPLGSQRRAAASVQCRRVYRCGAARVGRQLSARSSGIMSTYRSAATGNTCI